MMEAGTRKPVDAWPRRRRALVRSLWSAALVLVVGCGVSMAFEPSEVSQQEPRLAGLIPISEASNKPRPPLFVFQDEPTTRPGGLFAGPVTEPAEPIALLLPPQPIEAAMRVPSQPAQAVVVQTPQAPPVPQASPAAEVVSELVTPTAIDPSEQERLLVERVIRDCSEAGTGVLTDARVDEMATTKIHHANALANRGAQYAARQKLIEALRMISQAKDAQQGDRQFTSALAAGLRALEEAEDFAPRGTQLEGELELGLITAAHRTPIAQQSDSSNMLPRQMMDRYFRYAQLKLAMSVADQPAGSMALYALGKVTSQMGEMEPQRHRLAHRRAVAFQQAALMSHSQNHLAAHELAVLLAESGHFAAAQDLLLKVSMQEPNATVYENLAQVQQRMGLTEQAKIGHALAAQLARQGAGSASQIRWLAPEEFIRTSGGPAQLTPSPGNGALPMTRRPRYNRRTAMAPSSPAPSPRTRPAGSTPQPNWR